MDRIKIPKERNLEASKTGDTFVFDIETMGLPLEVERWGKPYPPFVEPKYGNTKDPIKREALYQSKYKEWQDGEEAWWKDQHEKAALNPLTGRIVAIGYLDPYVTREDDGSKLWDHIKIDGLTPNGNHDDEEAQMLMRFWSKFTAVSFTFGHVIGHNIEGFDLPFMMKRSWLLGVKISPTLTNGKFFSRCVVDTMKVWLNYAYNEYISLDKLSQILKVGQKPDYEAKQFAHDWLDGDKDTAEFYLKNDLSVTHGCYERLM